MNRNLPFLLCVVPEKVHTSLPQKVLCFAPHHPSGKSSLPSNFPSKSLFPLGISDGLLWKEYGYFLKPCKLNNFQHKKCIISVVINKRKRF